MDAEVSVFGDRLQTLQRFVLERYQVYTRRAAGDPKPWTDDPILRKYRFCNVYRDDDRVTRWLRENWYAPNSDNPDLWFGCVVARFFNLPDSLAELHFPVPWDPIHCKLVMSDRARRGFKNYNGAYMIRSGPGSKTEYLVDHVFTPLWQAREQLCPAVGASLTQYHFHLTSYTGLGSFLGAQVVADLKAYAPLRDATDWHSFAAPGPGSMRGLNRMLGRPPGSPWKPEEWHWNLLRLQRAMDPLLRPHLPRPLCAQDLQNCLCEVDKYLRVADGLRPKQLYPGV